MTYAHIKRFRIAGPHSVENKGSNYSIVFGHNYSVQSDSLQPKYCFQTLVRLVFIFPISFTGVDTHA